MSDDVQLPTVVGEGGEILHPDDTVRYLARQDEKALRALEFLQEAIYESQERLLDERNTFDVDGRREPNAGGYQSLARRFRIETKPVATEVTWEPNRVWLEHGEGDPVPEHCRARVTVRAVAPWGHAVERQRSCSTRGEKFHYKDGGFNQRAYMNAEHICVGMAETRAANAAVKAILGLTRDDDQEAGGAARGKDRRQEKRAEGRLQTLRSKWKRKIRQHRIEPEVERALARHTPELPDELEAWDEDADYYEYALELLERYGTRIFDRARQKMEDEEAPDPVREAEKKAGSRPEAITCPDCEEATLEPGMKACPNCGWLRDGPRETSSPSGDPSDPDTKAPSTGDGTDPPSSPTETTPSDGSDATSSEAEAFQESIERDPLPEDAEVEGEEAPQGRREQPEIVRKMKLIARIDDLVKQLGDDPLRPRFLLAEIRGKDLPADTTEDDLPELRMAGLNLLEEIRDRLEEEAADVSNATPDAGG